MLKDFYGQEIQAKKKIYKIKPQTIKKMAIVTYILTIVLNVNGLMLWPKDTDRLNGYKNKTHIYAVYKKPTSDLKTHINWKWENWNCIKHLFWPQGYEIRYQLQEKKCIKHKHMEAEQYVIK